MVALYDFSSNRDNELSFKSKDTIYLIKRSRNDQDWHEGFLDGRIGIFPANYVSSPSTRTLPMVDEKFDEKYAKRKQLESPPSRKVSQDTESEDCGSHEVSHALPPRPDDECCASKPAMTTQQSRTSSLVAEYTKRYLTK